MDCSFLSIGHKLYKDIRIIFINFPHEIAVKETQYELLEIIAWSFGCVAKTVWVDVKHDGQSWQKDNK